MRSLIRKKWFRSLLGLIIVVVLPLLISEALGPDTPVGAAVSEAVEDVSELWHTFKTDVLELPDDGDQKIISPAQDGSAPSGKTFADVVEKLTGESISNGEDATDTNSNPSESKDTQPATNPPSGADDAASNLTWNDIPEYNGDIYVPVLDNMPSFTVGEIAYADDCIQNNTVWEEYSDLDVLGRVGQATALVGYETMPTEDRGDISSVKPSGWHNAQYPGIDGGWLYNRCHLIGFQLAGENDNPKNLMTGTREFNVSAMLPFENLVADYVHSTGNHVLYRITPVFNGVDLLARGVVMEGYSVEDDGAGVSFCVFAYNVEPDGIAKIEYLTGKNWAA